MHRIFNRLSLKIAYKLPILFVLIAMISVISVGAFSISSTSDALISQEKHTLTALAEARSSSLSQYLESISEDIVITAASSNVQDALTRFTAGFKDEARRHNDPLQSLQGIYINEKATTSTNSFGSKEALGQKHLFDGPTVVEGIYHNQHQRFHPWFRQILSARGYYDIFLVDPEGNVVYTVFKELDYATNLLDGKYNQSGLSQAFKAALSSRKEGDISFVDFAPYAPSNGTPASFISTPVVSQSGFEGVLIFQMPIDRINQVLQLSVGMGETGETYLVGNDYLMRSDSRFSEESTILKNKVQTATVKKALEGETGAEITRDYRNIPVLSAYQPFDFQNVRWALIAEIDEQEMLAPAREARLFILMIGAIVLGVVALLGWLFARSIVRPIQKSTSEMLELADGNQSIEITGLDRKDEVGNIASALQTFKDNAIQQDQAASENLRIKSALDNCQANVMVADVDLTIIYMNDTMIDMMRTAESDIKKDLPNLDTDKLLGTNIDTFHKSPAHQRGLLANLKEPYSATIEVGGRTFNLIASPINDEKGERLGTVVEWDDVTVKLAEQQEADRIAQENARVKVALDSCTANVMVANNDFDIIYMNDAVLNMMRTGEADIRKDLTGFDTNKRLGGSIDRFHKNPAHQRSMLEALTTTYQGRINVGGRSFDLIANPITNEQGERLGTVVEWADVTAELAIEAEVDQMVNAISAGDFTKSLSAEGKEGFMLALTNALNSLNKNVSDVVDDVATALSSLSRGDLTHEITTAAITKPMATNWAERGNGITWSVTAVKIDKPS